MKLIIRIIGFLQSRFASPLGGNLIPRCCFRISACNRKNGFVRGQNCFFPVRGRNIRAGKFNDFSGARFRSRGRCRWLAQTRCRAGRITNATFMCSGALRPRLPEKRMPTLANRSNDAGGTVPRRDSRGLAADSRVSEPGAVDPPRRTKHKRAASSGAMSQQRTDSNRGNDQLAQRLVQLVGYRDPDARRPWIRPRRRSAKPA